jgi:hypothetical protein
MFITDINVDTATNTSSSVALAVCHLKRHNKNGSLPSKTSIHEYSYILYQWYKVHWNRNTLSAESVYTSLTTCMDGSKG